ncbi:pentatricopeptide repeat-containing protein At1g06270 [Durio zibethinus]|uniref:Pentatricopeptide repeat-containing protein At1g06270 n=1 Tax=Durio zibethinus TaxID=66656 RepID=A0A6P5WQD2_DURZI|nr:pentatricopeptide repeat-containing protein At1g06270 [Durio zibethinus]
MATVPTKLCRSLFNLYPRFCHPAIVHSISSFHSVDETVKAAVEAKTYTQLPDILIAVGKTGRVPNPFSFLSTFSLKLRTQIVDEILQSFKCIRPRSRSHIAYDLLLFYTLQSPHPLPLSFAILQCCLRSGCVPAPQVKLLLSSAWLSCHGQSQSVSDSLMEMQEIGYCPDSVTCNYIISSLCAVDLLEEAVKVLKGMSGAGCPPDLESYSGLIAAMCTFRRTVDAVELVKQMVQKARLTPRQGTVMKLVATLLANREIWKAVEMIEFLERKGNPVGFESYELVVEGCLECCEYILAGKVVIAMTERGFIPYIRVRQKVVEGLVNVNELKLAHSVRERLVELGS